MSPRVVVCLALLGLAGLTACDRPADLDRPLDAQGPFALSHHVAWTLAADPAVALLQPATGRVTFAALSAAPRRVFPEPAGRGLLVIGTDGAASWIPADERGVGQAVRMPLTGDYTAVAFGPDAGRAVLYHAPGSSGGVLSNPNQIAILDLGGGAAIERSLRSFGGEPLGVVLGPPQAVAGADRQMAWVLAERYLSVLDLAAPTAREVVVHLTLAEDTRSIRPAQVVFGEVEGAATFFVRAEGSDDLFALTFPDDAPADEVPRPYLTQLPAGAGPSDVLALQVAAGMRVFTADPGSATLSVIDPVTGRRVGVDAGARVSHLLPFRAQRADGEGEGWSALAWDDHGDTVVFVDLDLLERRRGRALTPLVLGAGVYDLQPLPGRRGAVARDARNRLLLLDFDARTATPLQAGRSLGAVRVDPGGDRIYATVVGDDSADYAVSVDVDTARVTAARLPASPGRLLLVPGAGRLVADHQAAWGWVSVLPLTDLDDDRVQVREGLLLQGAFDR